MSAGDFVDIALWNGFEANPNDAITLDAMAELPRPGQVEAWRLGKRFAQELRAQESLDGRSITDSDLASFAGSVRDVISVQTGHPSTISFALDRQEGHSYVSLRSRWETGRRFDLAASLVIVCSATR